RECLARLELRHVAAAVLTGVAVAREEEGVRDLPAKATRHVDELREPNYGWPRHGQSLGPHDAVGIRLDDFGLAVNHESERAPHGHHRQRLVRCVQCQATKHHENVPSFNRGSAHELPEYSQRERNEAIDGRAQPAATGATACAGRLYTRASYAGASDATRSCPNRSIFATVSFPLRRPANPPVNRPPAAFSRQVPGARSRADRRTGAVCPRRPRNSPGIPPTTAPPSSLGPSLEPRDQAERPRGRPASPPPGTQR